MNHTDSQHNSDDHDHPEAVTGVFSDLGEGANPVHGQQERLTAAFMDPLLDRLDDTTPVAACLKPLLQSLGWAGQGRHLMEALPHLEPLNEIDDLRAVLTRLNFATNYRSFRRSEIRAGMLPCLFSPDEGGSVSVILSIEADGRLLTFDGVKREYVSVPADKLRGDAYLVTASKDEDIYETIHKYGWVQYIGGQFKKSIFRLFSLAFTINLLALTVPIFVMNVYDKAIGAKSPMTLFYFVTGILIVIALEMGLRSLRARLISFLGARLESLIAIATIQQLLYLPVSMTESAPIAAQISRLKQFSSIRDAFVGQLGSALTDLPFVFTFLIAIFWLSGPLGFIPLTLFILFMVVAIITVPLTRRRIRLAGDARTRVRDFTMELAEKRRTIRETSSEDVWIDRCRAMFSNYLLRQYKAQQFNSILQTTSQMLVMVTGISTVSFGALLALNGDLTVGALIAVIALVWRLLSPIQAIFLGFNQLGQSLDTLKQVNKLMRLKPEQGPSHKATASRKIVGQISVADVSFRYDAKSDLALRGVNLEVQPGQLIAITGNSGAGKSTLLKLMTGLYRPQMGAIRIDGHDLRQLDSAEYRQSIGYVPEALDIFYGTIAQNLKLAEPEITDQQMLDALQDAGAGDLISTLPDGLDTRIKTTDKRAWTDGTLQELVLARAYVKDAPIYLFDDPGSRLDYVEDQLFIKKVKSLAGRATVVLVTHRPSHMECADRVVVMERGQIIANGLPDEIVPKLLKRTSQRKVS